MELEQRESLAGRPAPEAAVAAFRVTPWEQEESRHLAPIVAAW